MVGLTGNYGMGKSAALRMFSAMGASAIDADEIVRGLLEKKDVIEGIKKALGDGVLDGAGRLLKAKVSDIVFKDENLRLTLEGILHPLVFKELDRLISGMGGVVIVEAPLIFERGYEDRFQKTIAVYTDDDTAVRRLQASGIGREDAMMRLACQMPIAEKIKRADFTIDNSGSPDDTRRQVEAVYEELLKL